MVVLLTMQYWLMKSEPEVYSIWDLQHERTTVWDGVRNYQARNYLRSMQPDDLAFFYHSNASPPGIAGLMKILEAGIADPTQFDPSSDYYDAKSTINAPRWQTVRVEFVRAVKFVPLETLRQAFTLDELTVVRPGNRLSVMPIPQNTAEKLLQLASS